MKISGFSMVKNGDTLYYPVKEVILSALPIVDEFVIAIGDNDPGDHTMELVESIGSSKIKIVRTVWDTKKYPNGTENAHQTDIAKGHCTGDWLLYLQADEVLHEVDHSTIVRRCDELLANKEVEGLLFNYYHFWGDYNHYHRSHGWYPHEIRIVRNNPDIHSWESAQSFRRIPDFNGIHYRKQEGSYKLKVAAVDAHIYHYGWVRPPDFMNRKKKSLDTIHQGAEQSEKINPQKIFDYGDMRRIPLFHGTHPAVMKDRIAAMDWSDQLDFTGERNMLSRQLYKHEKLKYRALSWIENQIVHRPLFQFKNYELLDV